MAKIFLQNSLYLMPVNGCALCSVYDSMILNL